MRARYAVSLYRCGTARRSVGELAAWQTVKLQRYDATRYHLTSHVASLDGMVHLQVHVAPCHTDGEIEVVSTVRDCASAVTRPVPITPDPLLAQLPQWDLYKTSADADCGMDGAQPEIAWAFRDPPGC
jgi:hypothetical protein